MAQGRKTGGRQKGALNKFSGDVRAMVLKALEEAGGVQYLVDQSKSNPGAFIALVGKAMPREVTLDATADVRYQIITGVPQAGA